LSGLDPRAPLVLDIRDLGRRAGSLLRVDRTVPAPAELGTEAIGIPTGSDIELELRLESVEEGVLVSGTARVSVAGSCSRCLDPLGYEWVADLQELFCYRDADPDPEADEDLRWIDGHLVDLDPTLRDAVVLDLPLAPVCRDDCPGLCSECGARLADDPDHHHEVSDPRWAALAELLDDGRELGPDRSKED
jgi:uncharacterized protein